MTNQSQAVSGEGLSDERIKAILQGFVRRDTSDWNVKTDHIAFARAILSEGTASLVAENERLRAELTEQYDTTAALRAERDAARADRDSLRTQRDEWLAANSPDGWIDALRTQLAEAQKEARDLRERIGPSLHGGMP